MRKYETEEFYSEYDLNERLNELSDRLRKFRVESIIRVSSGGRYVLFYSHKTAPVSTAAFYEDDDTWSGAFYENEEWPISEYYRSSPDYSW
jgi:hypothetical protein